MPYSKRCKEEGHPVPVHINLPGKRWFKMLICYDALRIANANANANNKLKPLRRRVARNSMAITRTSGFENASV
eukprot:15424146-Heterocapsa_arctica.AAC.1